jgi:hypothetical protein
MDNTRSIFDQEEGEQLLIQEFTFDELELNAYDFLLEICRSFGWILLQKNGRWLIQRPIARNIEGTMIYVHSYVDGSVISSYANNAFDSAKDWYLNSIAANPYSGIAYGNGKFVAISNGSFNLLHSNDGITWETVTVGSFGLRAITFADGKFVAVGAEFSGLDLITNVEVSTDGINWTRYTPFTNAIGPNAITYGNGLFVVVGNLGSNRVMTSPDGISWTIRSVLGNDDNWQSVAYGNGKFIAIGISGDNRTMSSTDGINWVSVPVNVGSYKVIFSDGKFTTGQNYSTDGITWTNTTISPIIPYGITYGNGIFVAVGQAGTDRIAISEDATSWTIITAPALSGWTCVAYGDSKFVALADSGTNRSMISYSNESESLQTIADQSNAGTNWIPVNADQLLQYQRPIKKLTLTQGGLGQSIIANGEEFNESSWFLEGPYKPFDWTITPDPDTPIIQIFPNNIPAQSSYDDEEGVSWDIRFVPNGDETDQPIISKPVFLDFAGLSLDLEVDINYETSASAMAIAVKHVDSGGTTRYLGTSIIGS